MGNILALCSTICNAATTDNYHASGHDAAILVGDIAINDNIATS